MLDAAAGCGKLEEVVPKLVQQRWIEGCGGQDGGAQALLVAAMEQRVDAMALLMGGGAVGNGTVLGKALARPRKRPTRHR